MVNTDNGSAFRKGGDSGSLVYIIDSGRTSGIGIFVGAHPSAKYFVVTPMEFVTKNNYQFVNI